MAEVAGDFVEQVKETSIRIHTRVQQIESLRESLTRLTVPIDQERVAHTANVSAMVDTLARVMDMERELQEQINAMLGMRQRAMSLFAQLPPEEELLLTERCLQGKSVREIMLSHHISKRQFYRLYHDAMDHVQTLMQSSGRQEQVSF